MNKRFKLFAAAIITICTLVSFIYWNNREESSDIIPPTEAPQAIDVALSPEPTIDSQLDSELESLLPPPLSERELGNMIRHQWRSAEEEAKRIEIENETMHETVQNLMHKEFFIYMETSFEREDYIDVVMAEPRMVKLHQQLSSGDDAMRKEIFDSIRTMCNVYLNDLPLYHKPGTFSNVPTVQLPGGASACALLLGEFDTECTTLPLLVSMHEYIQNTGKKMMLQVHNEVYNGYISNRESRFFAEGAKMMLNRMLKDKALQAQLSPHQIEVLNEYDTYKTNEEQTTEETGGEFDISEQRIILEYAAKFVNKVQN